MAQPPRVPAGAATAALLLSLLIALALNMPSAAADNLVQHQLCECKDFSDFCHKWKCRTETEELDGENSCFAADESILLDSGELRRMAELRVGDRVQTLQLDSASQTWRTSFSLVYSFLHRDPELRSSEFVRISADAHRLTLSARHLLFCVRAGVDKPSLESAVACLADSVRLGDWVFVAPEDVTDSPRPARVSRVDTGVSVRGAFAPATLDGKIVVSGVLASVYAEVPSQSLVHAVFAPLRWWYQYVTDAPVTEALSQAVHSYAVFLRQISWWFLPLVVEAMS